MFAEFVFPGHPDKLCDAIADALVQAASSLEQRALVGVEIGVHDNFVFLTGRVACDDVETIDTDSIVREIYETAGYSEFWTPAPENLRIHNEICLESLVPDESTYRSLADDQSICVGYAKNTPDTNFLPPEQFLVNRLGRRISDLRLKEPELDIGPDGKIVLSLAQDHERLSLSSLSCSIQHRNTSDRIALRQSLRELVEQEMQYLSDCSSVFNPHVPDQIALNGAGNFERGGPEGDNGLAGKKLVVDCYGPHVPIGGGALSGKDFFKADRAGALHARRIAKAVVLTGNYCEALVHICWHPGNQRGELLSILVDGSQKLDVNPWLAMFDPSLSASGDSWSNQVDLVEVARFGHFTNNQYPWERIEFANTFDREKQSPSELMQA